VGGSVESRGNSKNNPHLKKALSKNVEGSFTQFILSLMLGQKGNFRGSLDEALPQRHTLCTVSKKTCHGGAHLKWATKNQFIIQDETWLLTGARNMNVTKKRKPGGRKENL